MQEFSFNKSYFCPFDTSDIPQYNIYGDCMKKITAFLLSLSFVFMLSSCSENSKIILDNSDRSKFIDFYTESDSVYIECELNIYSEKACDVTITAVDYDDVETGLLKSDRLEGITKDGGSIFSLKKGENTVTVLFRGEYAGIYQISKREIPRFIYIAET